MIMLADIHITRIFHLEIKKVLPGPSKFARSAGFLHKANHVSAGCTPHTLSIRINMKATPVKPTMSMIETLMAKIPLDIGMKAKPFVLPCLW